MPFWWALCIWAIPVLVALCMGPASSVALCMDYASCMPVQWPVYLAHSISVGPVYHRGQPRLRLRLRRHAPHAPPLL